MSVAALVLAAGVAAIVHLRPANDGGAAPHAASQPVLATTRGLVVPPAAPAAIAPAAVAPAGVLPVPPVERRPLSLAEWVAGNSSDWRVARLRENDQILVIEFPSLAEQGAALNRVAALMEKADAPRDRVLSDSELGALIARHGANAQTFYEGHDYDNASMSRFFQLAAAQRQPLNAHEERLRRVLVQAGFLGPDAQPPGSRRVQAVITFTAIQADNPATAVDETVDDVRRDAVLRHEYSHGWFFTRPAYREHCRRFWRDALTSTQREAIRTWLANLGYDRGNEELMVNEAQALLMHTPDIRAFDPASVGLSPEQVAALRHRFWQDAPRDEPDRALSGARGTR